MGLFNSISSIFRGRDAPTDRTSGSAHSFFMGGSTSGKRVNERTAMQMTAVYSCVRILSEAVAGLPLQFYRYTKDGGKEKAVDHPLYFLLHDEPNPEMTSFVFRETLMTHLLLWGNAYSQIIRNARGEIIALYPLMPDRMTVNREGDNVQELESIMETMCRKNDYTLTDGAKLKVAEVIQQSVSTKGDAFSNGRFIRNLYEDAVMSHARRVNKISKPSREDLVNIIEKDITSKQLSELNN